jgi:nitroreductase
MSYVLAIIQERQSARVSFDPNLPVSKENLNLILEAARWAPTAHNMQNFEAIAIDDKAVLEQMAISNSGFLRSSCEKIISSFRSPKRRS